MRIPITVISERFVSDDAQPDIDTARYAFADYLEQVPRKTRTKHGLMGPVGKILSKVRTGHRDPAFLKGYTVRVHEATVKSGRSPSSVAMQRLESGIDTLVKLLNRVPVTFHDRVLDRLDYGLYYELRKRQAAAWEAIQKAWIVYIREKYNSAEDLALAWDQTGISFEELSWPRRDEGSRTKKATARQKDIADFWESRGVPSPVEEEDE